MNEKNDQKKVCRSNGFEDLYIRGSYVFCGNCWALIGMKAQDRLDLYGHTVGLSHKEIKRIRSDEK